MARSQRGGPGMGGGRSTTGAVREAGARPAIVRAGGRQVPVAGPGIGVVAGVGCGCG